MKHPIITLAALLVCLNQGWSQHSEDIAIDFSHCGYRSSEVPIPMVAARLFVKHRDGDVTEVLQAAIDQLSKLPLDEQGYRGALLFDNGVFDIRGQLKVAASGIVLRGSGETTIRATGTDRRAVIRVVGKDDAQFEELERRVTEGVAVGGVELPLDSTAGLQVGDLVRVTRPSTKDWIAAIGMDRFLVGWRPGSRDIQWERRITSISGKTITIDAPITTALEGRFGGGQVQKLQQWTSRIANIGIENLTLMSSVSSKNPKDEDHAWTGVTIENVNDAWVRQVTFRQFVGSAVMLWETAKHVTVMDCLSLSPISEIGGHRRQAFFTMGEQTLFLRCWSEHGIRDFIAGHAAAGPNAFVACESYDSLGDSGSIGSWASGLLYDNVKIDGGRLRLDNQWVNHHAAGWTAANSVLWQCAAGEIHCDNPPTAANHAIGVWGRYYGDGGFRAEDEFVKPPSLFQAQLSKRSEVDLGPIGQRHFGATSPSYEQAEAFVRQSNVAPPTLRTIIEDAPSRDPLPVDRQGVPVFDGNPNKRPERASNTLTIGNGHLHVGGKPFTGKRLGVPWWRGNTRPGEAPKMGPALTRFVPGRVGLGFTDDLHDVARFMTENGYAAIDHNYGLWYDRRRDDHTRVRRADGDVWAPFYEQPFARSGEGKAWDGLSKYDLEKPNPWYWDRLKQFANIADSEGLLLYHQHYFQHNLLEAGAHWADSPWRSVNNINDTGFPEPPPYISDKRIFQAHLFYGLTHEKRRELHRKYIRQGLANFADNHNVIHFIGAEYTGPLSFVQFWIDTVIEWEADTGNTVWLALSCTKGVQDAILADPQRSAAIDIIDIRYWTYLADGLYAPKGGKNLAPRQHRRQLKPGKVSEVAIKRSISEYRERYPSKEVLYHGEVRD